MGVPGFQPVRVAVVRGGLRRQTVAARASGTAPAAAWPVRCPRRRSWRAERTGLRWLYPGHAVGAEPARLARHVLVRPAVPALDRRNVGGAAVARRPHAALARPEAGGAAPHLGVAAWDAGHCARSLVRVAGARRRAAGWGGLLAVGIDVGIELLWVAVRARYKRADGSLPWAAALVLAAGFMVRTGIVFVPGGKAP